ncbi:MAG TPA: ATP-binding protein [bacterium]|nr:ATP-binding protein [bacterium]HPM47156.1 ATP-binding protein [bacterium]
MRKKLSTSIYTFRTIKDQNCMYVDKTREMYDLVSRPNGQFFLSRPRRFGKSLTLSTLESIFFGEKELFKGLYIYDQEYDWKKYPVIRLALNQLSSSTAEELEENLALAIKNVAGKYGIVLETERSYQRFKELIQELHDNHAPVVILIDEYDKPILDNILEKEDVVKIRTLLKKFYGIIKASEEYLRFTFITGVSKFTQVSIFSDLNNLTDITLNPQFATICGFTQVECEHYFAEWIDENAVKNNMTKDQYLAKIKETYDGIRFTKKEAPVYNPVSFTRAMDEGSFSHYWFETGTPTFLLKLLQEKEYEIVDFEELKLKENMFSSYEIDKLRVEPLLFQTGYLTIKDYDPESDLYTLSYPNKEVRQSFVERLVDYFTPIAKEATPSLIEDLRAAFLNDDMDEVFYVLKVFYSKIDNTIKIKQEKYYQTVFYILFTLLGYRIKAEVNTNKGRMDAVIKTEKIIYIFEFKLNKTAKEAIEQIKQREYYQKYLLEKKTIKLIGIQFNHETGEVKEWEVEKI